MTKQVKKQEIQSVTTIKQAEALEAKPMTVSANIPADNSFLYQKESSSSVVKFAELLELAYPLTVAIDRLVSNPINPRQEIESDNDNLIESISTHGIMEPVKVLKLDDNNYRILQGHRRRFCAQTVGLLEIPCLVWDSLTVEQEVALVNDHSYQKPLSSKLEYYKSFESLYDAGVKLPDIAVSLWPIYKVIRPIDQELKNAIKTADTATRKQLIINRCKGYLQQLEIGYRLPERVTYTDDKGDTVVTEYPFKEWFIASLTGDINGNSALTYAEQKKIIKDISAESDKRVLTSILNTHLTRLLELKAGKTGKPGATAGRSTKDEADKRISKEALSAKIASLDSKVPAMATILSIANGEQPDLKAIESDLMLVDWLKSIKQWDICLELNKVRKGLGNVKQDADAILVINYSK